MGNPSIKNINRKLNHLWLRRHFKDDKDIALKKEYDERREELIKHTVKQSEGKKVEIKTFNADVSDKELRHHISKNEPLIVRGFAKEWPAVKKWDFDFFIDHYGEIDVPLFKKIKDLSEESHLVNIAKLGDVLQAIKDGQPKAYPRFLNLMNEFPALRKDIDKPRLVKLRKSFSFQQFFQLFIGYQNSRSKMHSGPDHNGFVQIYGEKRWILYPPNFNHYLSTNIDRTPYFTSDFDFYKQDAAYFDCMKSLPYYDFVLYPGDLLFNPAFYWHDVSNETPTIGFAFRWHHAVDILKLDAMKTLLTVCCYNPPIWEVMKYRDDGLKYHMKKAQEALRKNQMVKEEMKV